MQILFLLIKNEIYNGLQKFETSQAISHDHFVEIYPWFEYFTMIHGEQTVSSLFQ